ncbi:MAG: hypothetical protein ACE5JK_03485 [Candidatus Omnitrophota bacterium]
MIACDVVLLPSREAMEKAVEVNSEHVKKTGNSEIVLDIEKCLPHVTLAMGCIKEEKLKELDKVLKSIADDVLPVRLKTIPLKSGKASIRIEKSRDIELLHELVMIRMSPFFTYNVSKEMIYNFENEEISDITFDYIRKFSTQSSFENYIPHITVGHGDISTEVDSFEFASQELALCHLGDYCTCRKVILSHSV